MSELLESDIERPAHLYAESRGWIAFKIMRTSVKGFPDHFFARAGRIILIEFKKPGKGARTQQEKRHRELREKGVEVFVVDDLDDAKRILK